MANQFSAAAAAAAVQGAAVFPFAAPMAAPNAAQPAAAATQPAKARNESKGYVNVVIDFPLPQEDGSTQMVPVTVGSFDPWNPAPERASNSAFMASVSAFRHEMVEGIKTFIEGIEAGQAVPLPGQAPGGAFRLEARRTGKTEGAKDAAKYGADMAKSLVGTLFAKPATAQTTGS